ncbi:MAG: M15 family metallopeptidase [Actinobacteria bacterium]|nr:M15 family metallopeptidase [Actinomycetota bacterium]
MPIVFAVVLTLANVAASGLPRYQPAGEEAYTLDLELDGYVNGAMEPARMMTVSGCTLERDAAYTYSLMVEAAAIDGIRLRHESCYRSYSQQARAYDRRCPITDVPIYRTDETTGDRVQDGTRKMRVCSGPLTAPPGESNHGWGRAVDFRDSRNVLTCYDNEFHWLKLNAARFGWVHPPWAHCGMPNAEPWHWEYAGVIDASLIQFTPPNPTVLATAE